MNKLRKTQWASVKANQEFVTVQTFSGYRSSRMDPEGVRLILPPNVENEALGTAVLAALDASRFVLAQPREDVWIHPEATFDKRLYDLEFLKNASDEWVGLHMRKFGYKTRRELFKELLDCNVERRDQEIIISPTVHEKLEGWGGVPEDQHVVLPGSVTPAEVGEGVRLAMSRCR
ncbi:MAG TPA: hypothetical protein DCX91_07740 [Stenotrophomonas sp.]|nr:hypothetical protein [Stenotrophomonas sp.]